LQLLVTAVAVVDAFAIVVPVLSNSTSIVSILSVVVVLVSCVFAVFHEACVVKSLTSATRIGVSGRAGLNPEPDSSCSFEVAVNGGVEPCSSIVVPSDAKVLAPVTSVVANACSGVGVAIASAVVVVEDVIVVSEHAPSVHS
jgi:hypothetical protein